MDNQKYRDQLTLRTYNFSLAVIRSVKKFPPNDFVSRIISSQLIRSATSVGANVVEAQGSPTRKDFTNFMHHALKSSNESRYWLGLLRDTGNPEESMADILREAKELSKILGATVKSLKGKR